MTRLFTAKKSDALGAAASALCMVHCLATPFIFIAQACSTSCCSSGPSWWSSLDFVFLGISFFAVRQSTKNSSKEWIKKILWISWTSLTIILIDHQFGVIGLPAFLKYIAATSLIVFHLYNLRYCQCGENGTCAHSI